MAASGIVLLAHGSRGEKIEGARLKEITELLRDSLGDRNVVQPAFLQFNQPDLEGAVSSLFFRGMKDIIVLPYFLFEGAHFNRHIPAELSRLAEKYPGINIKMARGLGVDWRILEVLKERLREISRNGAPGSAKAPEIEQQSFGQISQLFPELDRSAEGLVRKRVLHATANPDLALTLEFHPQAIESGINALKAGKPIIADVRMVAVGVNQRLASGLGCKVLCAIEEYGPGEKDHEAAVTRTAAGMKRLASRVPGAVIVIGNAPTALLAVLDLLAKGLAPPALIIGVPVGFIQAAEAKAELARASVPYITLPGRQGGTPVAVASINALLKMI